MDLKQKLAVKAMAAQFAFLDDLRASGETNMYGAAPYLCREFGMHRDVARDVLRGWQDTYDPDVDVTTRATDALARAAAQ